jgi:serine/threonine protein kinase
MSGDSILPRLPKPGDVVDDKYEIVGVVGRGGMGIVFEALHRRLRQRVALKMLHPHVKEEPGVIERFEREARAAGQLLSTNVARVLDVATSSTGLPYIVMEFLDGRDLQDELEVKKQLPIQEAVDYVLQACAAMREAHALGIIHRDLKPANLFLCPTAEGPVVKILDFGISKITTEVDGRLTAAMTTLGSPIYMSPEQLRGASEVDARTDIWSLGVVLYELLAGQPPHAGTLTAVTAAIIADAPPRLALFRDDVPSALEAVIVKALQKYPAHRFADAESLAEALVPFASAASAKWLHARLSVAPSPLSSKRLGKRAAQPMDDDSLTMLGPPVSARGLASQAGAPISGSDTRHAMTTGSFERSGRASSRSRTLIVVGAIVAGAVGLFFVLRAPSAPPAARPIPVPAASITEAPTTSAAATNAPATNAPATSASPAPPAAAEVAPTASAATAPMRSATAKPPTSAPPRPHPAAAATNPLRL